jgi:DNA-binding NarL/FixJ family response regulator
MNLAIIDDHVLLLGGIKDIVAMNPRVQDVRTYGAAAQFLENYRPNEQQFDLVITDIDMPEMTGTELVTAIREQDPDQKILVLSMHKDHTLINTVFNLKVNGYLFKDSSPELLNEAIDCIVDKGRYITSDVERILNPTIEQKEHELTKREVQIVQLIAKGESNKTIGDQLFISETTVKTHRKNIMLKLGLRNTAELVRFAIEKKLA